MSLWRVFQLEESQFRVKEVSKASGSDGGRPGIGGRRVGRESNLPGAQHGLLSQRTVPIR